MRASRSRAHAPSSERPGLTSPGGMTATRQSADQAVAGPTIYDVAREAGVAASTVSRAFSNPTRVRAATREHILSVARELGYRPDPYRRSAVLRRTPAIGLGGGPSSKPGERRS